MNGQMETRLSERKLSKRFIKRYLSWSFVILLAVLIGYLMQEKNMLLEIASTLCGNVLFGHPPGPLEWLGSHQPPVENQIEKVATYPDPLIFFKKYVRLGKPLIFRHLAASMPAHQLWTDSYLREKFGNFQMNVEAQKTEDRKGDAINMTLEEYISRYQKEDLYLVESVPYEMLNDVMLPPSIRCQPFLRVMSDAVLWFSSGDTKSVLHFDEYDNINCLLDGSKEFLLADKKYESHFEMNDKNGAYSDIDVESLDMELHPKLKDVQWFNITLEKGDCIFIPYRWVHQVRSNPHRNMALNIWLIHLHWINEELCSETYSSNMSNSFQNYDFCSPSECLRAEIVCKTNGTDPLTFDTFHTLYKDYADVNIPIETVFTILDENNDGVLSLKEMYESKADMMLMLLPNYGHRNSQQFSGRYDAT